MEQSNSTRSLISRYLDNINSMQHILHRSINIVDDIQTNSNIFIRHLIADEQLIRGAQRDRFNLSPPFRTRLPRPYPTTLPRVDHPNITVPRPYPTTLPRVDHPNITVPDIIRAATSVQVPETNLNNTAEDVFYFDLPSVPIVPSPAQINSAVTTIIYNSENQQYNDMCPITLNPFRENETISQIISCGHCFNSDALNTWFRQSVRCPFCRYDIRDFVNPNILPRNLSQRMHNTSGNINSELIDNISRSIYNNLASVRTPIVDTFAFTINPFTLPSETLNEEMFDANSTNYPNVPPVPPVPPVPKCLHLFHLFHLFHLLKMFHLSPPVPYDSDYV